MYKTYSNTHGAEGFVKLISRCRNSLIHFQNAFIAAFAVDVVTCDVNAFSKAFLFSNTHTVTHTQSLAELRSIAPQLSP